MKKLFITGIACLLLAGCGSKELSREEALEMLKQEEQFPRVYDHDIFCGDPSHAKKVLDAGLENEGLLTVKRTQKIGDIGKPVD